MDVPLGASVSAADLASSANSCQGPDVVCLGQCALSIWKKPMSVSFKITESKCFYLNSGPQFMCMSVPGRVNCHVFIL